MSGYTTPPTNDVLVRFLGYLKGFGYTIEDSPNTPGAIDITNAEDANDVCVGYTGTHECAGDREALWAEGVAEVRRSAATNQFEAGTREYCEYPMHRDIEGNTIVPRDCGELVDSAQHWDAAGDRFLCPTHWEEFQTKQAAQSQS